MRLALAIDALTGNWAMNARAFRYVSTQLAARGLIALTQLYAIYVFSTIYQASDAALIFVLLGYGIWIQIFEFGLSQTLQNGLNSRILSVSDVCRIILLHYALMIIFAVSIVMLPGGLELFQGGFKTYERGVNVLAFPVGVALMIVTTNTFLVQRALLVLNRGLLVSKLILSQAILGIAVLSILQWRGARLIESVALYFAIPILVHTPVTLKFIGKLWRNRNKRILNWRWTFQNAFGFWGLNALSLIYLGGDYFFAAQYLAGQEMMAYHFSSRLFFISFVAYFSYVQYRARNITASTRLAYPAEILRVVRRGLAIGLLSVMLVVVVAIILDWSGVLDILEVKELLVMPLVLSAALYYGVRVFRDVGLVLVWNLGLQRFLYAVHLLEVISCFILLEVMAPMLGGAGIFYAMALVALISSILIYVSLFRTLSRVRQ